MLNHTRNYQATGFREHTGYRYTCWRTFDHHPANNPGTVHALTHRDYVQFIGYVWRALCGAKVAEGQKNIRKTGDANELKITCKKCLRILRHHQQQEDEARSSSRRT